MTDINIKLINEARKAMKNAYAPYSNFLVGAAVLAETGEIYTGCNVENASYGACICAEQIAIAKSVSEGKRKLSAIAIVSSSGDFTPPCGICRQVMSEFMSNGQAVLANEHGEIKIFKISELLPEQFILARSEL